MPILHLVSKREHPNRIIPSGRPFTHPVAVDEQLPAFPFRSPIVVPSGLDYTGLVGKVRCHLGPRRVVQNNSKVFYGNTDSREVSAKMGI